MTKEKKTTAKNKGGRPLGSDKSKQEEILKLLSEGHTLRSICKRDDMPNRSTVFEWVKSGGSFSNQYALAYQFNADVYTDMIIDQTKLLLDRAMAGEAQPHEVSATSLFVDGRKWIAARQAPKKYGKLAEMINEDGEIEKLTEIKITIENPVDLRKKPKAKKK